MSEVVLTNEERRAIAALQKAAAIWPKSLMVLTTGVPGGGLSVVRAPSKSETDLLTLPEIAAVAIPADGCG